VFAENHLGLGEFLLRKQRESPRHTLDISPEQLAAVAERWYIVAGSVFLWANNPRVAESFLSAGLKLLPSSAELRLIEGVRLEVEALDGTATVFSDAGLRARTRAERLRFLLLAKNQYQKLLKDHPALVRARVRLGRVLWVLDDLPEALVELTQARADSRDRKQQYLAAMFLGGLYEQQRNLAAAREAYEAALAFAPGSQAATVGLGYLEVLAGRPDRAQELARKLLLSKRQEDDWWSYRNGGIDLDALRWLQRWVTR
jgi:tetratricopeptide (TPR) repeat protein